MSDDTEATRLITEHLRWLTKRKRASQRTLDDRKRTLWFAHRHLPAGLLRSREDEIETFLNQPAWKPWTVYTYDTALRVFYAWAAQKGKMTFDPMVELAKPPTPEPQPRPMRDEHLVLLLSGPEPIPTVTMLGRYQGLRLGEIAGLYREDITEAATSIRRAKGGQPATVPTHPLVWAHIQSLPFGPGVTVRGQTVHPLIWSPRTGKLLTPWQIGYLWRRTRRQLGLPEHVVPHCNRHRFGTDLRRATGDILIAAKGLRHKNLQNTRIYTEVADLEVAEAMLALPQLPVPGPSRHGLPDAA